MAYVFHLALKIGYINKTHTHIDKVEPKTLYFNFFLTITKPFPPIYLEEMKNYYSLSVSRTISQVITRVHKPTVAYKLALQEEPKGAS